MGKKTSVISHSRKGTKGVSAHTRELADSLAKTVPGNVDDELIAIAEFRTREARNLAVDEINLEHRWMDLQTKVYTLTRQGLKVPQAIKNEQEKVFNKMSKLTKRRMKTVGLIRQSTKSLNVNKRRALIRKEFTHRGITKIIS